MAMSRSGVWSPLPTRHVRTQAVSTLEFTTSKHELVNRKTKFSEENRWNRLGEYAETYQFTDFQSELVNPDAHP